jgi:uncharacterized repeat protein (TIGR01451 family)
MRSRTVSHPPSVGTSLWLMAATGARRIGMKRLAMLGTFVLTALVLLAALVLMPHPAAAQDTALTVSLTASATKSKVGDFIGFTVRLENTGTEPIPAVSVNLELPDALNAQGVVNCPGDTHGIGTFCEVGDLAPGSIVEVLFIVQIGSKEPNGPVTVFAASGDTVLTAQIPPLKIVGPSHQKPV